MIMSNGTASLIFLKPDTMERIKQVIVTDNKGKVGYLNELEFIDGEIYANIWTTDLIARISPDTGKITGWVNLEGLNPSPESLRKRNVLNGIAYDKIAGKIYITGKCWPRLYEIELIPLR